MTRKLLILAPFMLAALTFANVGENFDELSGKWSFEFAFKIRQAALSYALFVVADESLQLEEDALNREVETLNFRDGS